jgi:hypothetical protein
MLLAAAPVKFRLGIFAEALPLSAPLQLLELRIMTCFLHDFEYP